MGKMKVLDTKQKVTNYVQKRREAVQEAHAVKTGYYELKQLEDQFKEARKAYEGRCVDARPAFNTAWDRISKDAKKYFAALETSTPVEVDEKKDMEGDTLVKEVLGVI